GPGAGAPLGDLGFGFLFFFFFGLSLYFLSRLSRSELSDVALLGNRDGSGSSTSSDSGIIPFLLRSTIASTLSIGTECQLLSLSNPNHITFLKISVFCSVASPF